MLYMTLLSFVHPVRFDNSFDEFLNFFFVLQPSYLFFTPVFSSQLLGEYEIDPKYALNFFFVENNHVFSDVTFWSLKFLGVDNELPFKIFSMFFFPVIKRK